MRCREVDVALVKEALPAAQAKYQAEFGEAAPQVGEGLGGWVG